MRFEDGAAVVTARCNGVCEVCGEEPRNQTHHRQPRQMGGVHREGLAVNRPSCLVGIGPRCHDWLETQERAVAYDLGLLVRRPTDPTTVKVWLCTLYGEGWYLLSEDGCYQVLDLDGDLPPVLPGERTRDLRS